IRTDLSYVEEPEAILDRQDRVMRKKTSFRQDSWEEPSRAGSHLGNRGVYPDFLSSFPSMIRQNQIDLPRNTPLDRVKVLCMIEKRSKVRIREVSTEMKLVLEQS
nr:hypothetical protein [Tanacetum cinerariifolium]